jgi:hypothetical protein
MLSRLLLFAFLGFLVWRAWRSFTRTLRDRQPERPAAPRNDQKSAALKVDDMARCPVCSTYVTAAAGACARGDCPRRR